MEVERFLLTNQEFDFISKAKQLSATKVFLTVIERLRDEERRLNEANPKIDNGNLKNDFRYKLGMIGAFNMLLDLPGEAQEYIKNLEGD